MNDNTKEWLGRVRDLGGVIAPFILAGSTVADLIDITDKYITDNENVVLDVNKYELRVAY